MIVWSHLLILREYIEMVCFGPVQNCCVEVALDGYREKLSRMELSDSRLEENTNIWLGRILYLVFICQQGGATRDPPDQSQDEGLSGTNNSVATPPIPVPAIVKVSELLNTSAVPLTYPHLKHLPFPTEHHMLTLSRPLHSEQSKTSDKNRHKKPKDVKPKVKKLKYHQYIPPDQKPEKSPPPMDSAYARLLQQQQLFLQLQILSQQKHSHAHPQTQQQQHTHSPQAQAQQRQPTFSYQPHLPAQNHK